MRHHPDGRPVNSKLLTRVIFNGFCQSPSNFNTRPGASRLKHVDGLNTGRPGASRLIYVHDLNTLRVWGTPLSAFYSLVIVKLSLAFGSLNSSVWFALFQKIQSSQSWSNQALSVFLREESRPKSLLRRVKIQWLSQRKPLLQRKLPQRNLREDRLTILDWTIFELRESYVCLDTILVELRSYN